MLTRSEADLTHLADRETPWSREDDKRLIRDVTFEAGRIALDFFARHVTAWEKSPGDPVSEADIAVDTFLRSTLMQNRAGYGWMSEESSRQSGHANLTRTWVVDPIDGTRAFLRGDDDWGISVALVEQGQPVIAAFYAPVRDSFYFATQGEGTTRNGYDLTVGAHATLNKAHMMGAGEAFRDARTWPVAWPEGMTTETANSIALRMCTVAAGEADCCVTLRAKNEWDVAAADLIVREAGGVVLTGFGMRLDFDSGDPFFQHIVACSPGLVDDIMARVTPALANTQCPGLRP